MVGHGWKHIEYVDIICINTVMLTKHCLVHYGIMMMSNCIYRMNLLGQARSVLRSETSW